MEKKDPIDILELYTKKVINRDKQTDGHDPCHVQKHHRTEQIHSTILVDQSK